MDNQEHQVRPAWVHPSLSNTALILKSVLLACGMYDTGAVTACLDDVDKDDDCRRDGGHYHPCTKLTSLLQEA